MVAIAEIPADLGKGHPGKLAGKVDRHLAGKSDWAQTIGGGELGRGQVEIISDLLLDPLESRPWCAGAHPVSQHPARLSGIQWAAENPRMNIQLENRSK